MAEATITNPLSALTDVFNLMKEVYLLKDINKKVNAITAFDMELPVLGEGVTFNTGDASVTKVKLTTGEIWTALAEAGDADIKFQVSSLAGPINDFFMKKVGVSADTTATIGGATYSAQGYDFSPKKVSGGLFLLSEDRKMAIFLPNVEGYASLVSEKGKPAYFNTAWSPKKDADGAMVYILKKKA